MARRNNQEVLSGQIPSQEDVDQLLTQIDFVPDGQLPETGNFNTQNQDDYDRNHNRHRNRNRTGPIMDNGDNDMILLKSRFDNKLQLYRFIHENKNSEGKRISGTTRKMKWKEIVDLYNNLGLSNGPISHYLINTPEIKWESFIEDERYWRLWDEKEDMVLEDRELRRGRNRSRRDDRTERFNEHSKSRSRSRDHDHN